MSEFRTLQVLRPHQVDDTSEPHPEMWQYVGDGNQDTCLADDNDNSAIVQQNQWYPIGASPVNPSVGGVWGGHTFADLETAYDLQGTASVIAATFHLRYQIPTWELSTNPMLNTAVNTGGSGANINPVPLQLSPGFELWDLELPLDADHLQFGAMSPETMTAIFTGASPLSTDEGGVPFDGVYLALGQDGSDDTGDTTILWIKAWYEIEYVPLEVPPPVVFQPNLTADLGEIRQTFATSA